MTRTADGRRVHPSGGRRVQSAWGPSCDEVERVSTDDLMSPPNAGPRRCRSVGLLAALSAPTRNVTVSFAALSYAGRLRITLAADPGTCPDLSALRQMLDEEVRVLTAAEQPRRTP